MSVACRLECVLCVGCLRWAWKRLTYIGAYDSENWPLAAPDDFEPVPRICQIIMAIYEDDIAKPKFAPPGLGYDDICSEGIHKLATYAHVKTDCPPYIVYARPPAQRGRTRRTRTQPRPQRRLQGPHGQQARPADVRRRVRALRPAQGGAVHTGEGDGHAAGPAATARARVQARLRGPLARLRHRRAHDHTGGQQPQGVRRYSQEPRTLLRARARPLHVAQPRRQVRRRHLLHRAAGTTCSAPSPNISCPISCRRIF